MKMNTNNIKAIAHADQTACGAAPGPNNRARTQLSKRDKQRCPKRQRKTRFWSREY